ncbi:MAG: hypothetical protein J5I57_08605, partial [Melioribacteraceae bacterium]|nr:hypothetical protein [Melioribacteraceae bacterium]
LSSRIACINPFGSKEIDQGTDNNKYEKNSARLIIKVERYRKQKEYSRPLRVNKKLTKNQHKEKEEQEEAAVK